MSEFQYLTPCFKWTTECNLDWAAVSAMGGWVAAIVTFFAVLLPYRHLRKEAIARQKADDVDADIAVRNAAIAIAAIFTGLNELHKGIAREKSLDSAKAGVELVRRHIAPNPLPEFPKSEKYAKLRVKVAHLGAAIAGLKVYIASLDNEFFDEETAEQFVITANAAIEIFGEVIQQIDASVPGMSLAKQLYIGK